MAILSQTKIAPFSYKHIIKPEDAMYPSVTCAIYCYAAPEDHMVKNSIVYPDTSGVIQDPSDYTQGNVPGITPEGKAPMPNMKYIGRQVHINGVKVTEQEFEQWKSNPKGIAEILNDYNLSFPGTRESSPCLRVETITNNQTTEFLTVRSGGASSEGYTNKVYMYTIDGRSELTSSVAVGTYKAYLQNSKIKTGVYLGVWSQSTGRQFSFSPASGVKISHVYGAMEGLNYIRDCYYCKSSFAQVNVDGTYTNISINPQASLPMPNLVMYLNNQKFIIKDAPNYIVGIYPGGLDNCGHYIGRLSSLGTPTIINCNNMLMVKVQTDSGTIRNLPNLEVVDETYTTSTSSTGQVYDNCPKLRALKIAITSNILTFSGKFINGTPVPQYIFVPSTMVESYKSASGWSDYADRIMASS